MSLSTRNPTSRALTLAAVVALGAHASTNAQVRSAPSREIFESGRLQYPGATWVRVQAPSTWGWSEEALSNAESYFDGLESASVMVIHRGVLMAAWGNTSARYNGQSLRKPLLGALIGQEIEAGRIDLHASLAEMRLDDAPQPLTPQEKTARLVDLLQSRSGIYLSAVYEAGSWKRHKPERGAHTPGEFWYYNNWGFNALGTIFEQASGSTIHQAFAERIARPIGMEDYRPEDVQYLTRDSPGEKMQKNDSAHDAYIFMISTRDMARFGLLYLGGGKWRNQEVVPGNWIDQSVGDHVPTLDFLEGDRWGYLWWVSPLESGFGQSVGRASYKATGGRGHKTVVVPDLELVVVHRLATGGVDLQSQLDRRINGAPSVDDAEFAELMRRIVVAHPDNQ